MDSSTYRDMHLLQELTETPQVTQRELSKRIGIALGLTNLMLRRLIKKGYIKISGTKRSRIRYLITPTGILEKSRLTYEFVQYSLELYGRIRQSLRKQLEVLVQEGNRRIVLYGTGELAEIAFLTIREMGLEVVGVVAEPPSPARFLEYTVGAPAEIPAGGYDRLVVVSLSGGQEEVKRLTALGVPPERIIVVPQPRLEPAAIPLTEQAEPEPVEAA